MVTLKEKVKVGALVARPAGSLVAVQPLSDGVHESVAQEGGLGVVGPGAELLEADGCSQVLAQGVPPAK